MQQTHSFRVNYNINWIKCILLLWHPPLPYRESYITFWYCMIFFLKGFTVNKVMRQTYHMKLHVLCQLQQEVDAHDVKFRCKSLLGQSQVNKVSFLDALKMAASNDFFHHCVWLLFLNQMDQTGTRSTNYFVYSKCSSQVICTGNKISLFLSKTTHRSSPDSTGTRARCHQIRSASLSAKPLKVYSLAQYRGFWMSSR